METIDTQNVIISMQSKVINDLFTALMQHISAEEADELACVKDINRIAELKKSI